MTTDPIRVLDHGLVRLIDHMGDDMTIVRSARVSYNAEPRGDGSDAKLIRYLMKNRHTSPFEAVSTPGTPSQPPARSAGSVRASP